LKHSEKCILSGICKLKDDPAHCQSTCSSYIALHGLNGKGGRCFSAEIPKDYGFVTHANSPVRESQTTVYDALDAYEKTFTRQLDEQAPRIKSVYLWSRSPGTGKTTAASGLANSYLIAHYVESLKRSMSPLQKPVLFVDVNQLQTYYNQFNRPRVPEDIAGPAAKTYYKTIESSKRTPFVVLDDVGIREATDGFRGDLHSIINERLTNQLPTVYTSNLPIKELVNVFGEPRLVDRIRDMTAEVEFKGVSKRGLRK
jgi:DNA replication protein DnaC